MSILIITNKEDITSDFIVSKLKVQQIPFYRLNTDDIGESTKVVLDISKNIFCVKDKHKTIDLQNTKSVYFRRPELKIYSTGLTKGESNFLRSELTYTLEGVYRILQDAFWLNNIYAIRNAENKIYQLLIAKEIGFNIPQSLITNEPAEALSFYNNLKGECVIKPIKSGLVQGDNEEGVIFTSTLCLDEEKAKRIENCPVFLQSNVVKQYDIRVTVVGNTIFAAKIHSQDIQESKIDWRKSEYPLMHSKIILPKKIQLQCLELLKRFSLNYGAIDLILDKHNNYIFLEINPNGQWAWIEKQLGYNISQAIIQILQNGMVA